MEWSQSFDLAAPLDRAWDALVDRTEPTPWNHVFTGDPYYSRGTVQVEEVERVDQGPERRLAWTETSPDRTAKMTVSLVETETGARLTLTRFRFGEATDRPGLDEARFLGWSESLRDFALFLETGLQAQRHVRGGATFLRLALMGISEVETAAGVVAQAVGEGGLARQAGMRDGDLFLQANGAPIFTRSDLWLFQRLLQPGQRVALAYVRDGEVRQGEAVVPAA